MSALFLTGFIGKRLLSSLYRKFRYEKIYLLVEPSMVRRAENEVGKMTFRDRIEIVEGDITIRNLKLGPEKFREITHLFHLAAIYDLTVDFEPAYRVNVEGTRNVLEFAANLPSLEKFLPLPYMGKGDAPVNLVPVDFVVRATVELTALDRSTGKTYHLTDPERLTAGELYRLFSVSGFSLKITRIHR